MDLATSATETVVRHHLDALLERRGVAAIVSDYDPDARFITEDRTYRGTQEIHEFFDGFIAALPAGAIEHFTLRSLRVERDVAYITWCVADDIPLGTDTFVVDNDKIVAQTFAMHAVVAR
ncbi:nuclear transport factor 2 family protein [Actinomycetospora sp. CA-101289]|uniref:nuclear transport factor 2 family protein n=1 Tax=Actinomycetospora sp. CA-101289 TaxID=3239893 RepID=UPI003D974761